MTIDPTAHAAALVRQLGADRALGVATTYCEMEDAAYYGADHWRGVADAIRAFPDDGQERRSIWPWRYGAPVRTCDLCFVGKQHTEAECDDRRIGGSDE